MSAGVAAPPISKSWRELYKAAVFERDKIGCLSASLTQNGLSLCVHENCFTQAAKVSKSGQAVDAAIYALYALRRSTVCAEGRKGTGGVRAA